MNENFLEGKINRAVLVGLNAACLSADENASEESLEELEALLETAGGQCMGMVLQNKATPDPRTFIGEGKVEEVREYCESNGLHHVNPQKFVDHYTANGWIRGKVPVKDWQAVARIWDSEDSASQSDKTAEKLPDIPGVVTW